MAFPDTDLDVIIEAFLGADPTADPGTWPAATDLSSRLLKKPINITTGRRSGQKTAAAGSCSFWLDNDDGALTPLLATSTYYPDWDLGCPVRVSVDNVGDSPPYPQFCGYVNDITAEMVPGVGGVNLSVVKVTLGGPLRRLGQGSVAKSAINRTMLGRNITAPGYYWSFEDGADATVFGSDLGGLSIPITDPTHVLPGEDDSIAGSAPLVTIENFDNGGITGETGTQSTIVPLSGIGSAGFTVSFVVRCTLVQSSHVRLLAFAMDGATGLDQVVIQAYSSTTGGVLNNYFGVAVALLNGVSLVDFAGYDSTAGSPLTYPNLFDGEPHSIIATVAQDGANIDLTLIVDGVTFTDTATTVTLGEPESVNLPAARSTFAFGGGTDNGDNRGSVTTLGHLAIGSDAPADLHEALDGYAGEQAHVRFARLCEEEGIPYSSTATESREVGPQPLADVLAVLRDLETVDHGFLSELKGNWGLGYRAGSQRYNLSPAMTIDLATYRTTDGTSREVLRPVRNDQRIRNEWTITRPMGSPQTAKDEAHQAKRGRYNDSAEVNVQTDGDAGHEASWRVRECTDESGRYAGIPLDLAANSAAPSDLLTDWLELELGDRIDRVNHLAQHPTGTVSVLMEGHTSQLNPKGWTAGVVSEPLEPWRVQQLADTPPDDDLLDGWLIPDTCELASGVNSSAASWSVSISPLMSTSADDLPARAVIGGEEVAVTAVSGASSPQTWTVTRSVNGVQKAHSSGDDIELLDPIVASL